MPLTPEALCFDLEKAVKLSPIQRDGFLSDEYLILLMLYLMPNMEWLNEQESDVPGMNHFVQLLPKNRHVVWDRFVSPPLEGKENFLFEAIKCLVEQYKEEKEQAVRCFFMINQSNAHWVAWVLEITNCQAVMTQGGKTTLTLTLLDSLCPNRKRAKQSLEKSIRDVCERLKKTYGSQLKGVTRVESVVLQKGNDCGLAMIVNGLNKVCGYTVSDKNYRMLRGELFKMASMHNQKVARKSFDSSSDLSSSGDEADDEADEVIKKTRMKSGRKKKKLAGAETVSVATQTELSTIEKKVNELIASCEAYLQKVKKTSSTLPDDHPLCVKYRVVEAALNILKNQKKIADAQERYDQFVEKLKRNRRVLRASPDKRTLALFITLIAITSGLALAFLLPAAKYRWGTVRFYKPVKGQEKMEDVYRKIEPPVSSRKN
ncbi:MAG: hypothetical protein HY939_07435 [Gammaproteobacteria bacterium]|nr:hypothetical protein [Gammaproteobacteria bacterium]